MGSTALSVCEQRRCSIPASLPSIFETSGKSPARCRLFAGRGRQASRQTPLVHLEMRTWRTATGHHRIAANREDLRENNQSFSGRGLNCSLHFPGILPVCGWQCNGGWPSLPARSFRLSKRSLYQFVQQGGTVIFTNEHTASSHQYMR